jgi:hypothetical protein
MRRRLPIVPLLLLPCTAASAQSMVGPGPHWGTTGTAVARVTAFECATFLPTQTWMQVLGTFGRYLNAGGAFECALNVPAGAKIVRIELEASDTTVNGEVKASLISAASPGGPVVYHGTVSTGVSATPDWNRFGLDLPAPVTVDNRAKNYAFEVQNTTTDGLTWFASVRAYYQLQVSPGPATATFNDVPTSSPFFRFVEALAAAGVTSGCGGDNYCPSSPVTRGQMAVFLASALGMHWGN